VIHLKGYLSTIFLIVIVGCFIGTTALLAESPGEKENEFNQPVADIKIGTHSIGWTPKVEYKSLTLSVSVPDGTVFSKTFKSSDSLYLDLSDNKGNFPDGVYTYELMVEPTKGKKKRSGENRNDEGILPWKALKQTGYFSVNRSGFVTETATTEGIAKPQDVLHYDDVIITGSLCIGFDCVDGESFGFDTIILKEHNLRIYFNDTSYTASYPTNNWRITVNDSTNGGASYFSIDDVDDGSSIFKIEAGAPANSLYVEDYGRVGLGTSTPVVELHIKDSDTPTVRLEQDSSGGWTAQTWDVAGNESNFFIRDATNGSKLPFRIEPSTPSSTLCLKSNGYVGIGTWSPEAQFEIEKTGENAAVIFQRTDGATGKFTARPSEVYMGTSSDHPVRIVANNTKIMTLESGGDVGIGSDNPSYKLQVWNDGGTAYGYCDGGAWLTGSSRKFKENIRDLNAVESLNAFMALNPIRFSYKGEHGDEQLGFIAEDVPQLVAVKNRDAVSAMDIVTLLTKVVQEQQKSIQAQQSTISELKKEIVEIKKKTETR
jgi:hypothetical protein